MTSISIKEMIDRLEEVKDIAEACHTPWKPKMDSKYHIQYLQEKNSGYSGAIYNLIRDLRKIQRTELRIETDVPYPDHPMVKTPWKTLAEKMDVGDSVEVVGETEASSLHSAIKYKYGKNSAIMKKLGGGPNRGIIRVWRIE